MEKGYLNFNLGLELHNFPTLDMYIINIVKKKREEEQLKRHQAEDFPSHLS